MVLSIQSNHQFEDGDFEMLTDGEEVRQFLYAEDCCEGLETVMKNYDEFYANDPLHITNFDYTTIREVAIIIENEFRLINVIHLVQEPL